MSEPTEPVTGLHATDGRPHDRTSLTPHIVVSPAAEALEFYRAAFGATIEDVSPFGGLIAHAEVVFPLGVLTLSDPMAEYGLVAPDPQSEAVYSLALYVRDVDAAVGRAVGLGATVREPAANFITGDRFASILDPFGVRWTLMTRVEDLSPDEGRRRVAEWLAAQG